MPTSARGKPVALSGLLRTPASPYQPRGASSTRPTNALFSLVDDFSPSQLTPRRRQAGAAPRGSGRSTSSSRQRFSRATASTTPGQKKSSASATTERQRRAEHKHYIRSRKAGVDANFRESTKDFTKHAFSVREVQEKAAEDHRGPKN